MSSVSERAIVQLQDYLNLGGEARMNFPGTMGSNWTWRVKKGYNTKALAAKIFELTARYDRAPKSDENAKSC